MNGLIDELRGLVTLVLGAAMAIVGAKMGDDMLKMLGVGIVCGALGMTVPGRAPAIRDSNARTRSTDGP
ncbi:MAG TPA: hypothetical protein VMS92_22865 [Mycobacterium sp.]|nr:hypothetical protein [Mycobacterium sp.]